MKNETPVLCVDLDGTLVKTDLLYENILHILKSNPLMIFSLLIWLVQGKITFKKMVGAQSNIDFKSLPFNKQVLELMQERKSAGSKICLVSANTETTVQGVANEIGLFDEVFFTDEHRNLKGKNKAKFLTDKFGSKGFDYVGDHCCDAPVFQAANKSYLVSKHECLQNYFQKKGISFEKVFLQERNSMKVFFKTIRIHQWSKNILVFLPLMLSHRILEAPFLFKAIYSFFAISCTASATYILNDLFDLTSDRLHKTKSRRPIASGAVSISTAIGWMVALLILAVTLGSIVSVTLLKLLVIYMIVTMSYSIRLKRVVMLDVLILAFLYTLRILIGSWVVGVPLSQWLFSFSIFLFCSLGFLKRNNEMVNKTAETEKTGIHGRGYLLRDLPIIQLFGITTGVAAVLIFVLYINSDQVRLLYKINYWLWIVAPMILYWLSRLWMIASRGDMHEDPVVFTIKDRHGYFVFFLIALCMVFAKIGLMPL